MFPIFFLLMGSIFSVMFVRGLATGRMSGKFGISERKGDPRGFWMYAVTTGALAIFMLFSAWRSSLPGN